MNFLAHVALSSDTAEAWGCSTSETEGLVAGAIIGDFVKGRIPVDWPTELRTGVALHRKVDALSNLHPAVSKTSARFPKDLRRYAPIFLDMLADHSLARHWQHYYQDEVGSYAEQCYLAISRYNDLLPTRAHRFVGYMMDADLLSHYDDWGNISDGLESVLRRLSKAPDKAHVLDTCSKLVAASDDMLTELYPDLQRDLAVWDQVSAAR